MACKRPNLVFVFGDQLGRDHCGYAKATSARTPHIDALARDSMDFRNAVSTMPVCGAYRASLLTGKYPTSTGMVINELRMNTDHECLGHVLTRGGYQTAWIGKWHLYANELGNHDQPRNSFTPPGPDRLGFDGYWAAYGFHHEYYKGYYHTDSAEKISYGPGVYEPDAQTDMAIEHLRAAAGQDDPFALFVSYGTPHDPWTPDNVPPEYIAMFEDEPLPGPVSYVGHDDPYGDKWAKDLSEADRAQLQQWRRVYYAMVANLDANVGRLLAAIDEMGLTDDTIFVFTSDHGEMFGAHGRRAKNTFYEEAIRVPLLMRSPRNCPVGDISETCISTVDLMPTLLSLLKLPIPEAVEGMDLSHCIRGQAGAQPDAALLQNTGACAAWQDGYEWRALRDTQFTYAVYRRDGAELLFDNVADPHQISNLIGEASHADAAARFRKSLADRMKSLNDTFECCTWYRDNWTKDRRILRGAKG